MERLLFLTKIIEQAAITKEMSLEAMEFIRAFCHAYSSKRFCAHKALWYCAAALLNRHALLSSKLSYHQCRKQKIRKQKRKYLIRTECPCCKKETMLTILRFNRRGPPVDWEDVAKKILESLS